MICHVRSSQNKVTHKKTPVLLHFYQSLLFPRVLSSMSASRCWLCDALEEKARNPAVGPSWLLSLTMCCRWSRALGHFWLLTTAHGHQWFWKWVSVGWAVSEPPGGLVKNAVYKPRNSDTVTCGKEPWNLQKGLSSPGYYEAQSNLKSANLHKILLPSNYTKRS